MRRIAPTTLALTVALTTATVLSTPACGQDAPPAGKDGGTPPAPKADGPAAPAPAPAPKRDEGVFKTTASGLEYQVLVEGKGKQSPKTGDNVKVNYKGWREDGFVFDESARHGGPVSFAVGGLIEGWNEALSMMTAGAKWKLRIPSKLGYGAQGAGADIPPNATLLFELELLEVTPAPVMPEFVKPVPAAQKTTETGLKYEVLKDGEGDAPKATDSMELKFAYFGPTGKLVDCTERSGTIKARPQDMRLPFLKEAPLLMKPGAKFRFEVPAALAFGAQARGADVPANSVTYWDLEMVRVIKPLELPKFEAIDESKFQKSKSGLQWQVMKEGEGASPKLGENVKVHYAGWLTDGTLFDSSYGRGEPAEFRLGQVIAGWNEGLQLMKPGGVTRFVIPAALAYGDQAMGEIIKPGSTLVFRVELISSSK